MNDSLLSEGAGLDGDVARAYSSFLTRSDAATFDPYYSQEILRFALRETDVVVGPGDVSASEASCGALLASVRAGVTTTVCGIEPAKALACFDALDGARTLAAARLVSGVDASTWELFVTRTFGTLVFAPFALTELERRVSHAEVVRFPGSPYEIVRAYWENMGDVRARVDSAPDGLRDVDAFAALLRELNVLSHVGDGGESFYRPASPVVAREGATPGTFWHTPSVTEETPGGVRFVSGPRVGAALIGGERYHGFLARSLGDEGALAPARVVTADGSSWGGIVTARADADEHAAPWFCPPRPFGAAHLDAIRVALSAARAAARERRLDDAVRCAGSVHWRLVRLHPFMSGNQSVAMALVNGVLREASGAGLPHLVLDHLALRLTLPAYEEVFARAFRAWLVKDESPVRRALELATRRRRLFAFLETLRQAPEERVAALLDERRADAALAFLTPSI